MTTLMGCIGPGGDFETVFFAALQGPLQVTQASDGSGGSITFEVAPQQAS